MRRTVYLHLNLCQCRCISFWVYQIYIHPCSLVIPPSNQVKSPAFPVCLSCISHGKIRPPSRPVQFTDFAYWQKSLFSRGGSVHVTFPIPWVVSKRRFWQKSGFRPTGRPDQKCVLQDFQCRSGYPAKVWIWKANFVIFGGQRIIGPHWRPHPWVEVALQFLLFSLVWFVSTSVCYTNLRGLLKPDLSYWFGALAPFLGSDFLGHWKGIQFAIFSFQHGFLGSHCHQKVHKVQLSQFVGLIAPPFLGSKHVCFNPREKRAEGTSDHKFTATQRPGPGTLSTRGRQVSPKRRRNWYHLTAFFR